ncbi:MAG: Bax inhibitor-1/YccA family protein [Alphaproteobacteria bacterium]
MDFKSDNNTVYGRRAAGQAPFVDEGLRSYMISIYNLMSLGLGLTGLVAYFVATTPELIQLFILSPLRWVVMFAPMGIVFFLSLRIQALSSPAARAAFWAFASIMGLSMASIFLVFTGQSVARVFFITASVFGGMSLYGYTTRRDLSGFGSFLFMGLIGIVIASVVNLFMASSVLQFAISVIGVLVFTGLTAYDTQRLKEMYYSTQSSSDNVSKLAVMGALSLYLNFINLFISLLYLFGDRR